MSSRLDQLEPWLAPHAKRLLGMFPRLVVNSVYRSYSEQVALWNNRANNVYPVAPPGRSWHQYRRAFDLGGPESLLRQAGAVWRSWGGTWNESDVIHFQA